jgi:dethiobiotin synthetase
MKGAVMRGIFIAGTDTGVGKTVIAAALIRALARQGLRVAGMKPVAAGAQMTSAGLRNADALALLHAANVAASYEIMNPYCFAAPIAPHIAARDAGVVIDLKLLRQRFDELAAHADCVVVEGAGGWLTPISDCASMADIAAALALPVVLVVGLRLGCLNHAILTARALQADGASFSGWIGNSIDPAFERATDNIAELARLMQPAAAIVPYAAHGPESLELPLAAALDLVSQRASSVTQTRAIL